MPGCRGVWGRAGVVVSSVPPSSPWATESLVSLKPAHHHLTGSLVSQLRKGAKRKEGRWVASSLRSPGHCSGLLFPTQNYLPRLPALTRVPGRSHAKNSGGTLRVSRPPQRKQRKQSRGARNECLAPPTHLTQEQGPLLSLDTGVTASPSYPRCLP